MNENDLSFFNTKFSSFHVKNFSKMPTLAKLYAQVSTELIPKPLGKKDKSQVSKKTAERKIFFRQNIPAPKTVENEGAMGSARNCPEYMKLYRVPLVEIPQKKNQDFQELVGDPNIDSVSTGFLHVLAFPLVMKIMAHKDFPLPLLGMIHMSNHIDQYRRIADTEKLEIEAYIGGFEHHSKGTVTKTVAKIYSYTKGSKELVWREISTYLAKAVTGIVSSAATKSEEKTQAASKLSSHHLEDAKEDPFSVPLQTSVWDVPSSVGLRYGRISGDINPIHMTNISAKILKAKNKIAHGMYLASRALSDVGLVKGDSFSWSIDFKKPVYVPSQVFLSFTDDFSIEAWISGDRSNRHWNSTTFTSWQSGKNAPAFVGSVKKISYDPKVGS